MNNPVDGIFILKVLRGFTLVVAVFAFSLSARAQGVGSSRGLSSGDGNHTIQGRVHMPSGQSVTGKTIKVILETTSSMGGSSTVADPDGSFRFNNLRPGRYTVVVDVGKEYEAPRETVDIDPGAGPLFLLFIFFSPPPHPPTPLLPRVPPSPGLVFF